MSNLVLQNNAVVEQKRNQLSLMLQKVSIAISRDQFHDLVRLTAFYLNNSDPVYLEEKSLFITIFEIYRKKMANQVLRLSETVKLNYSIPEAYAMREMLNGLYIENPYTDTLRHVIVDNINRQTV